MTSTAVKTRVGGSLAVLVFLLLPSVWDARLVASAQDARPPAVQTVDVSFTVDTGEVAVPRTVRGTLYLPSGASGCGGVQLLIHGFSYGSWVWDLPGRPNYSYARYAASKGYAVVAVDNLGYGRSDHPNGYTVTTEELGVVAHQLVSKLRTGSYQGTLHPAFRRVILGGHSAGGEIARYEAGAFHDVDGLMVMSMGNNVTQESADAYEKYNVPASLQSDYVYPFFGSQDRRLYFFYQQDLADPSVMAEDSSLENATPSGEIQTILTFPSRAVIGTINVPVLLVFAQNDKIVPVSESQTEPARYSGAPSVSVMVIPKAGHTFPLHQNRQVSYRHLVEWLASQPLIAPRCQ